MTARRAVTTSRTMSDPNMKQAIDALTDMALVSSHNGITVAEKVERVIEDMQALTSSFRGEVMERTFQPLPVVAREDDGRVVRVEITRRKDNG